MFQTISNLFQPIRVHKDATSFTVPDMSYTPREIISKFSRGEKVPLGFRGLYDDDNGIDDPFYDDPTRDPNFDSFDYTEEKIALDERNKEREKSSRSKVEAGADPKRKASDEELSASDATKRETTSEGAAPAPDAQ